MSMDLDAPVALSARPSVPQQTATQVSALHPKQSGTPTANITPSILCCNCGAPIDGTLAAGALCSDCVRQTVDISQGIQREGVLHTCRDCERWLQPPSHWLSAAPESRELLALCLRKLRGLSKVRLTDASFIWTEPHSRRIKVKVEIQQEIFQDTILKQDFIVEYVVHTHQCPDCAKSFTANTWRAVVQVRQKVPHKRTFLYLEQLILKHSAHKDTINIREAHSGLDFFFAQRNHADNFLSFLTSLLPTRTKKSQELISTDIHTSTKSYKFSYSVELVPLCKDDLLALPPPLARSLGHISPLTLCTRISTTLTLLDPSTLQTAELPPPTYCRNPFPPLADTHALTTFIIMDIEPVQPPVQKGRFLLAEATVARSSDLGVNDTTYFTRTHLGAILHPGDTAHGYHLTGANFNNAHFSALEAHPSHAAQIPDVVLVKKAYAERKKGKPRGWRVKRMVRQEGEEEAGGSGGRKQEQERERVERDFEMFLREVEENEEVRREMALYKARETGKKGEKERGKGAEAMEVEEEEGGGEEDDGDGDGEELPEIDMDELLDDFDELSVGEKEEEE